MLIYMVCTSKAAQTVWALINHFVTIAILIAIILLGIAIVLGGLVGKSTTKSTKGFLGVIYTIIAFVGKKGWRFISWSIRKVKRSLKSLWRCLFRNLLSGFQKYVSNTPAQVLSKVFSTLIILTIIVII